MTADPTQIRATPEQIERARAHIQYVRAVMCAANNELTDTGGVPYLVSNKELACIHSAASALMIAEKLDQLTVAAREISYHLEHVAHKLGGQ